MYLMQGGQIVAAAAQKLERLDRTALRKPLRKFERRPDPPRGLRVTSGGLQWEEPKERGNVTHYKIYVGGDTERHVAQVVPVGQFKSRALPPGVAFVSAASDRTGQESQKVRAGYVSSDLIEKFQFVVPGAIAIGEDINVRLDAAVACVPYFTSINAKTAPSGGDLIIDILHTDLTPDPEDPPGWTWESFFPDGDANKLILPEDQYYARYDTSIFRPNLVIAEGDLVRQDCIEANGATAIFLQVRATP